MGLRDVRRTCAWSHAVWLCCCGGVVGGTPHPQITHPQLTRGSWRWSLWEILWLAGPVFILWFFCLPETSASNILLRRSMRLRKLSQNDNISSQSQIDRKGLTPGAVAVEALIKPFEITIKDPAVLFTNVYTALIYGTYYSFFEVFPLVYGPMYGFNLGETGVVFTCIVVGCVLAMGIYFYYLLYMLIPDIHKNGLRAQESRLRPALIFVFGPVIGLFLFGRLLQICSSARLPTKCDLQVGVRTQMFIGS